VSLHLDRIRERAQIDLKAKVVSENSFPASTGLSSSASGFAALTVAAAKAASLALTEKNLSILARLGSGSACRSIPDGITEWIAGKNNEDSYAVSLYPSDYWEIMDVVAVISSEKKEISTTEGHSFAETSPFFSARLEHVDEKIRLIKKYIKNRNFSAFGELAETEALELHAIMMTSRPSLLYLRPETVEIMRHVQDWRRQGLPVYFSLNTGQDIHILCKKSDFPSLQRLLSRLPRVRRIIPNHPANGVRLISAHLF
jgi:diphosphomevalonate decarboxylase